MPVRNPLSIFVMSRSRLLLDQPLLGNSSRKRRELHFFPPLTPFSAFIDLLVRVYPLKLDATCKYYFKQRYFNKEKIGRPPSCNLPKQITLFIDANKH